MDKGLTQGGTSSPALFRAFINDLPETVRNALRAQGKLQTDLDPTRLVADDVVGMVNGVESLQILLDACHEWATQNKLKWNPRKSQILCMSVDADLMTTEVNLGGSPLKWVNEVEYLGLRLSREGFLGKKPSEVEKNRKDALQLLMNEGWFTLDIEPKHIINEFNSRVRSQLEYGAELLSYDA